ncbi:uncharacterized protein LOC131619215 [Vicia villosa]|uniref:uncharacterized protein LOC131619215 n=1 Tax=Vicia villosa TaxID=3911 RepID=UPI00273B7270|nr:uncharacterized protein LOC131619215 [Vicia villosa]
MDCIPAQKVHYGTHMLEIEADVWWLETHSYRIYEEDNNAHYKILNEKQGKHQHNCGKSYDAPVGKGKQKVANGQRTSAGDTPTGVVCFKFGKPGHKSNACTTKVNRCFCCGEVGHIITDCKCKEVVCFNCGEEGHISSQCQKPKKAQSVGIVFARTQTATKDRMIKDTCIINIAHLITIIDTGATHCFIVADCVDKLGLVLSSMNGEMVVDTPAKGSVTTSLVCLKSPLSIFDIDFAVDLVCLPLS